MPSRGNQETWREAVDGDLSCEHYKAISAEEALEEIRAAASEIDPHRAEIMWAYADVMDPYGILGCAYGCIGRVFYVRNPGSDIWVAEYDLPETVRSEFFNSGRRDRAIEECVDSSGLRLPW